MQEQESEFNSKKICKECLLEKKLKEFYIITQKNGSKKYRNKCISCLNKLNKEWRIQNKTKLMVKNTINYEKNKEKRLESNKKWREKNKEKVKQNRNNKYKNNLEYMLWKSAKIRAQKNNLEFNIEVTDIVIPNICPVLNIPIFYQPTGGKPTHYSPSLDRIDNNKGYIKGNIEVISWRANNLKRDATMTELKSIVSYYENYKHFKPKYADELKRSMEYLASKNNIVFFGQAVEFEGTGMTNSLKCVGPEIKIEAPVFENTQLGMAIGMTLNSDTIPVCIFPRWNFLICATDQLVNHLDKISLMSGGQFKPKIIIRTSVGSEKPLHPQHQHVGNFTDAYRLMCPNIDFIELNEPEDIFPAYKKAYERTDGKSTVLVEFGDYLNEK